MAVQKSFKRIREERINEIGCCELCGRKMGYELHHIIPRSLGGDDSEDNLILICRLCHARLTPKSTLTKIGLTRCNFRHYLRYLRKKFSVLTSEVYVEWGWPTDSATCGEIGIYAFEKLLDEEMSRLEETRKMIPTDKELNAFDQEAERRIAETDMAYEEFRKG